MSNSSSKLHVLGDSYTTPGYCVEPQDSFWGLAAQELGIGTVNYSYPGFSLDHFVHILLNGEFNFAQDYFIIGVPPLLRYIGYQDHSGTAWPAQEFDLNFSAKVVPTAYLTNTQRLRFEEQFKNSREAIDHFSLEWNDVQCLEKIYLIHQYLSFHSAKFIIVNLSDPLHFQESWPPAQRIMTTVRDLPECVIFDHTYYSVNRQDQIKPADFEQYQWQGHHGAEGNANWYNKVIKPKMIELNWIKHA